MISALVGHLAGDYLLQNDWQALNKKSPGWQGRMACAAHCAIWTASVCMFAQWFNPISVAVLFATHFLQDRTKIVRRYMSLMGQDRFADGPCKPWSIIAVDNVLHIVTLWAVWKILEGGT